MQPRRKSGSRSPARCAPEKLHIAPASEHRKWDELLFGYRANFPKNRKLIAYFFLILGKNFTFLKKFSRIWENLMAYFPEKNAMAVRAGSSARAAYCLFYQRV